MPRTTVIIQVPICDGTKCYTMPVVVSIIPPPPTDYDGFLTTISVIYVVLCTVGLLGNAGVCSILIHLLRTIGSRLPARQVFVYLLGLCVADALLLFTIPLLLLDMYLGHWPWGATACRVHLTLESVTKLLSTFILTALSFDRYLAVCRPHCARFRSVKCALIVLVCYAAVTAVLLLPLPIYAAPEQTGQSTPFLINNETGFIFVRMKCHDKMPERVHKAFNIYTFVIGFCLPGLAIVVCYWRLLRKVFWHTKRMRHSRIPIKRVTTYTLLVVTLYFSCWAPYWVSNILYKPQASSANSNMYMYIMYIIHILPYLNSASNWIIYALLNKQLSDSARSAATATRTNEESFRRPSVARRTSYLVSEMDGSEEKCQLRPINGTKLNVERPRLPARFNNNQSSTPPPVTTVSNHDDETSDTIYNV